MNELLIDQLESIREDIANMIVDIKSEAVVSAVSREDIVTVLLNRAEDIDGIVAEHSDAINRYVDSVSDGQLAQIARKMSYLLQDAYWDALDEAIQRVMGQTWIETALQEESYDIDQ
jgi:hypothetical protein